MRVFGAVFSSCYLSRRRRRKARAKYKVTVPSTLAPIGLLPRFPAEHPAWLQTFQHHTTSSEKYFQHFKHLHFPVQRGGLQLQETDIVTNLVRQARKPRGRGCRHPSRPVAGLHHHCRSHGHPPCLGASTDLRHIAPVAIFPAAGRSRPLSFVSSMLPTRPSRLCRFLLDSACASFSCLLTYVVSL